MKLHTYTCTPCVKEQRHPRSCNAQVKTGNAEFDFFVPENARSDGWCSCYPKVLGCKDTVLPRGNTTSERHLFTETCVTAGKAATRARVKSFLTHFSFVVSCVAVVQRALRQSHQRELTADS